MAKERMQFIPELQTKIADNLEKHQGVGRHLVTRAFERWHAGQEPETPWDRGCFAVFEQVQNDLNSNTEPQ